jgi:hypothetical protein
MSLDVFLGVLAGASIVVAVVIIVFSKKRGGKSTPWMDETISTDIDMDD